MFLHPPENVQLVDVLMEVLQQYGKDLEALAPNFGPTITEQIASAEKTFAALDATLKAKGA